MSILDRIIKGKKATRVGIDISLTTVKLLELSESNGGFRVESYSVSSLLQKVPVLGDLPGVGTLFRSTANTNKKVETLIFITPRILSEVLLD